MSCPETKEELMTWFDHVPDYNYHALEKIIDHGSYEDDIPWLWNAIHDHGFCYKVKNNAWISRTGMIYSCGWGKHEMLLNYMGLKTYDVEKAGWVRVSGINSPTNVRGMFRPTAKQLRILKTISAWDYVHDEYWARSDNYDEISVIMQYEK